MKAIALLRGMNVGGHRITNAELVAHFQDMGFTGVWTYRASGNVGFSLADDRLDAIERIEEGLASRLGYAVPTMVRTAAEIEAVVAFSGIDPDIVAASEGKLQVTFFKAVPSDADREAVLAMSTDADRLAIEGRELYWLPEGWTSKSELDLKAIHRRLGVGTNRTMGTVQNLAKKLR